MNTVFVTLGVVFLATGVAFSIGGEGAWSVWATVGVVFLALGFALGRRDEVESDPTETAD